MTAKEFKKTVVPCKDFEAMQQSVEASGSGWTIVDLHHVADQIVERAGLPLFQIEIPDCPENAELLNAIAESDNELAELRGAARGDAVSGGRRK